MSELLDVYTEMDFNDLKPIEVSVKYKGERYLLAEASEDAVRQYQNAIMKSTKLGPDGKPASVEGFADVGSLLLSLCLFKIETDPKTRQDVRKPMSISAIRTWPHKVTKPLVKRVKEISELETGEDTVQSLESQIAALQKRLDTMKGAEDAPKNGLGGMGATSDSQQT